MNIIQRMEFIEAEAERLIGHLEVSRDHAYRRLLIISAMNSAYIAGQETERENALPKMPSIQLSDEREGSGIPEKTRLMSEWTENEWDIAQRRCF